MSDIIGNNGRPKINYGTFFCAASKGDLEVVKYLVELIEKDTPIATWMDSERDDDESSYAVWEAASNGHLEVVKYLVGEKGAYIGISTAFYAGTNGHLEVLKYLVDEKGAKIDDIKDAVKHCIEHGHLEVVKYLVEKLTTPEPKVTPTEGDSKMKDIQEVYRKRVFDELTPVQLDEILLGEIDELNPPIKIGSLEFKASEIIKQLRPDVLENNDFLVALFESEEWYESMMNGLDGGYCWLYPPKDEKGEYLKYEGVNPEKDHSFFRYKDCQRIMRKVQIDFLQEYKNILLQENQNDLLQEVKKQFQYYEDELKHEDPVEIEIYSEDTSVRRFLNINGEESFRAVEKPEPAVIPEPQAKSDYDKALETAEDALNYAVDVLNAPFPEGETLIATDAYSSYSYADCILKAPFPLGEAAIATDAQYSYEYSQDVLHAPFPLGEAAIATNAHIFKMYKNLFPEPIQPIEVRTGVILQEVTEGCSCEKYVVHEGCVANEGDTWTDFTENLKVGEMSIVKDNTGECPKCGKDIKFKEYYIVTNVEFRTK